MVSQGSLYEEDGILPDFPVQWDFDHAIPRSSDHEEFSSAEESSSDEDLMYQLSLVPCFTRLQRVALRHKYRVYEAEMYLERERRNMSRLELQIDEQVELIDELSTRIVELKLEPDDAKRLAHRWKICSCVLAIVPLVIIVCHREASYFSFSASSLVS